MNYSSATLISGPTPHTNSSCQKMITKILCKKSSCKSCIDCTLLQEKRHHHCLWIQPEKKYTLETIAPIFSTIEFILQEDESFFFILEKADLLTPACANSLLKIVEEPPRGYYFFFLTTQAQLIIPTIRSRCHIIYTTEQQSSALHPFLRHFTKAPTSPIIFFKELQSETLQDHEIPQAIDQLLTYWTQEYCNNLAEESIDAHKAHRMISLLQKTAEHLPMPGSTKIFWRNLYLAKDRAISHATT